ncbi:hypothetical protein [Nocardia cyriacigeorgica]|uniref:hypothetical protein n=1 Tax=Nocardia cyriacigeorgica TaxID=135487 RepID=UPI0018935985|nr:hypothetical protein [Nocardia cyriacigeorgica]MBF6494790.1 hypothetical protein [Nocardia cyriacigeorgica]
MSREVFIVLLMTNWIVQTPRQGFCKNWPLILPPTEIRESTALLTSFTRPRQLLVDAEGVVGFPWFGFEGELGQFLIAGAAGRGRADDSVDDRLIGTLAGCARRIEVAHIGGDGATGDGCGSMPVDLDRLADGDVRAALGRWIQRKRQPRRGQGARQIESETFGPDQYRHVLVTSGVLGGFAQREPRLLTATQEGFPADAEVVHVDARTRRHRPRRIADIGDREIHPQPPGRRPLRFHRPGEMRGRRIQQPQLRARQRRPPTLLDTRRVTGALQEHNPADPERADDENHQRRDNPTPPPRTHRTSATRRPTTLRVEPESRIRIGHEGPAARTMSTGVWWMRAAARDGTAGLR